MILLDLIPKESKKWFSAIFHFTNSYEFENREDILPIRVAIVDSEFYQTNYFKIDSYYKPAILL